MASNLLVIITYFDAIRRRTAEESLNRSSMQPTCQTRGTPPPTHSNEVPPTAMLSTIYLTEISDDNADSDSIFDDLSNNTTTPSQHKRNSR